MPGRPIALPALILSAPLPDRDWDSSAVPFGAEPRFQALLGWEAQLQCFGAALTRAGARCVVTPAPEQFFHPRASRALAQALGGMPPLASAVHLRFGPARLARVLRIVANLLVHAECAGAPLAALGGHPFGDHQTAPAAFRATLNLHVRALPLFRPDRTPIAGCLAPATLHGADLGVDPDPAALSIVPLIRHQPAYWPAAVPPAAGPEILLPWNLADPASRVPALAARLAALTPGPLLLLPFNLTQTVAEALRAPIEALLQDGDPTRLWIARVTGAAGIAPLRRRAPVAWIDAQDPEAAWTAARLAACGIATRTIAGAGFAETVAVSDARGLRYFQRHAVGAPELERQVKTFFF